MRLDEMLDDVDCCDIVRSYDGCMDSQMICICQSSIFIVNNLVKDSLWTPSHLAKTPLKPPGDWLRCVNLTPDLAASDFSESRCIARGLPLENHSTDVMEPF